MYFGPLEEAKQFLEPFFAIQPVIHDISSVPWDQVGSKWGFGTDVGLSTYGGQKNLYSGHIKKFDLPTFDWYFETVKKLWDENPPCRGTLCFIEDWPSKKMAEIPDDENAFPHRDVICQM
jgi:hypothetical protein